jgi:hypothetical protein
VEPGMIISAHAQSLNELLIQNCIQEVPARHRVCLAFKKEFA